MQRDPLGFFQRARNRYGELFTLPFGTALARTVWVWDPVLVEQIIAAPAENTCFLAASQQRTFDYFDALAPGRHRLELLPGYTHLDVFLGREAHRNVFPLIVEALGD